MNTSEAAVLAAIDGAGFARVMSYKMDDAMRAGKLAIVLEEFEPKPFPVHLLYARHKPMPLKLRAFLNWMTPRLKDRLTFLDQHGSGPKAGILSTNRDVRISASVAIGSSDRINRLLAVP